MMSIRTGTKLHSSLDAVLDYPYTISFAIRKAQQIESFFELPKDKRPDESIWDNGKELENWIENMNEPTKMELVIEDVE